MSFLLSTLCQESCDKNLNLKFAFVPKVNLSNLSLESSLHLVNLSITCQESLSVHIVNSFFIKVIVFIIFFIVGVIFSF
jgi:hypothetical protein